MRRWKSTCCLAEPLETRLLFALAKAAGGSGYSANLSTNYTIRQQQLLCDPAEPKAGSTSVLYDASIVSLVGYKPGPGYDNQGFLGYVEVIPPGQDSKTVLQPLVAFLSNPLGTETGYVQVKYELSGQAGQLQPDPGFEVVDSGGVLGVDTHGLTFELLPGVPVGTYSAFTVFAAPAGKYSNNSGDYLETNDGTGTILGPTDLSPAFVSTNLRPVISSAGAYAINEGDSLTLHADASDADSPASSLVYSWDLDGDGTADASGADVVVSAAALRSLGLGDGGFAGNIELSVSDGEKTATASAAITVSNVKPVAAINGVAGTLTGVTLSLSATDASADDAAAGFTYLIDWGDGSPVQTVAATANNGSGSSISHIYASIGGYNVTVQAVDKDGATSDAVTLSGSVSGAQMLPDPSNPSKLALFVVGTNGSDQIRFAKSGGGLRVLINAASAGVFKGFTRVIAYGAAGNDDILLTDAEAVLFGGEGDDKLVAGNFKTILSGGAGADVLSSGNAKDLLVGGLGGDHLNGGDGDDLLVAGRTTFDNGTYDDIRALSSILNEWYRGNSYENRIAHITGTLSGGLNGSALFSTTGPLRTAFDDDDVDTVLGGNGRDWLLLGASDQSDLASSEIGTPL